MRWAEGVFLAAVGAERKPATIALLEQLGRQVTPVEPGNEVFASPSRRSSLALVDGIGSRRSNRRDNRQARATRAPSSSATASPVTTHESRRAGCCSTSSTPARPSNSAEIWEKVVRKLRAGHDAAERRAAARWATLDRLPRRSRPRSIALPRRRARIRAPRRCIGLNRTDTPTPSAICSICRSTRRRCCRATTRAKASTTSPTCSACRPR